MPVSYGFRPMRRAHDAIAEIHQYGTQGYRWVLDADIEACFDSIDYAALMHRVRLRVKDKLMQVLIEHRQRDVGQQRRQNATYRTPVDGSSATPTTSWCWWPGPRRTPNSALGNLYPHLCPA